MQDSPKDVGGKLSPNWSNGRVQCPRFLQPSLCRLRSVEIQHTLTTELRKSLCTWLREYYRQVQAEVISNSSNKLHQTTYKDFFSALYNECHCYLKILCVLILPLMGISLIELKHARSACLSSYFQMVYDTFARFGCDRHWGLPRVPGRVCGISTREGTLNKRRERATHRPQSPPQGEGKGTLRHVPNICRP